MGEIVDLSARRAAKKAEEAEWWEGPCTCLGCRHTWEGAGTLGFYSNLECPSCGLPKGTVTYPFGAAVGDEVLTCTVCLGEALTAYKRDGVHHIRCMGCGADMTESFYNG